MKNCNDKQKTQINRLEMVIIMWGLVEFALILSAERLQNIGGTDKGGFLVWKKTTHLHYIQECFGKSSFSQIINMPFTSSWSQPVQ